MRLFGDKLGSMTEPNIERAQQAIEVIKNPESSEADKKAAWATLWQEQQKISPANGTQQYDGRAGSRKTQ